MPRLPSLVAFTCSALGAQSIEVVPRDLATAEGSGFLNEWQRTDDQMPLRVQYLYHRDQVPWAGRAVQLHGFWLRRKVNLGADYLRHRKGVRIDVSTNTVATGQVAAVYDNNHGANRMEVYGTGTTTRMLTLTSLQGPGCTPPRCSPPSPVAFGNSSRSFYIPFDTAFPVPQQFTYLVLDIIVDETLDDNGVPLLDFYDWVPDATQTTAGPGRVQDVVVCANGSGLPGDTSCYSCGGSTVLACDTNNGMTPGSPVRLQFPTGFFNQPGATILGARLASPFFFLSQWLYVEPTLCVPGTTSAFGCGELELDATLPDSFPVGMALHYQFGVIDSNNDVLLSCAYAATAAPPAPGAGQLASVIANGGSFQPFAPGARGTVRDSVVILGADVR